MKLEIVGVAPADDGQVGQYLFLRCMDGRPRENLSKLLSDDIYGAPAIAFPSTASERQAGWHYKIYLNTNFINPDSVDMAPIFHNLSEIGPNLPLLLHKLRAHSITFHSDKVKQDLLDLLIEGQNSCNNLLEIVSEDVLQQMQLLISKGGVPPEHLPLIVMWAVLRLHYPHAQQKALTLSNDIKVVEQQVRTMFSFFVNQDKCPLSNEEPVIFLLSQNLYTFFGNETFIVNGDGELNRLIEGIAMTDRVASDFMALVPPAQAGGSAGGPVGDLSEARPSYPDRACFFTLSPAASREELLDQSCGEAPSRGGGGSIISDEICEERSDQGFSAQMDADALSFVNISKLFDFNPRLDREVENFIAKISGVLASLFNELIVPAFTARGCNDSLVAEWQEDILPIAINMVDKSIYVSSKLVGRYFLAMRNLAEIMRFYATNSTSSDVNGGKRHIGLARALQQFYNIGCTMMKQGVDQKTLRQKAQLIAEVRRENYFLNEGSTHHWKIAPQ